MNPVVVTTSAAKEHGAEIGTALVTSFTLGSGQLCTKPGFILVPDDAEGTTLVRAAVAELAGATDHVLLNESIFDGYVQATARYSRRSDVTTHSAPATSGQGYRVTPVLLEIDLADLDDSLVHEVFGPIAVVVRYPAADPVTATKTLFEMLPSSLTATLHTTDGDDVAPLLAVASAHAGRILFGGFPTGVAVSWAQNHGGPWPATNTVHTSVGATAIRRFVRPLTYQNAPESALPEELRDGYQAIPRRVDGVLHTARS